MLLCVLINVFLTKIMITYRMANIFTIRCSSKIVPEKRILTNCLLKRLNYKYGTEYNSWSALSNYTTRNYCKFTRSSRRLQSIVGVYTILRTPASNPKAQTLARNIYFNSGLNSYYVGITKTSSSSFFCEPYGCGSLVFSSPHSGIRGNALPQTLVGNLRLTE